jgi:HEAT repeat protein
LLQRIGAPALEELVKAVGDGAAAAGTELVETLGKIGGPVAVEPLISILKNASAAFPAKAALEALSRIGDRRCVQPLIEATTKDDTAFDAGYALARVLSRHAVKLEERDLRALVDLPGREWSVYEPYTGPCNFEGQWVKARFDPSQIRQLARQELIRRGLKA